GMGGQLVGVFQDRALGLPPLNSTLALRMMEQTKIYTALQGVRGRRPVDIAGLQHLLVRFSQLVVEQRLIKELDINPLLASPDRLIALDARVVLYEQGVREEDRPTLAIRPYPLQYVQPWTALDGTRLVLRPIRPEDEPLMVRFHETLSEQTVYGRYFEHLALGDRIAHERLTRICFNDYDREIALVAERRGTDDEPEIIAVGRMSRRHAVNCAEFALLVADRYQNLGLGGELLERLVRIGRDEKLDWLVADIQADNIAMQHVAERTGFTLDPAEDGRVRARMRLLPASSDAPVLVAAGAYLPCE
ncbi:MAG TPA: GNAT family N-acetyltransferase, partial [Candidatus Limnocylindrales bacterium]